MGKIGNIAPGAVILALLLPGAAHAESFGEIIAGLTQANLSTAAGAAIVFVLIGAAAIAILTSRRMKGASIFSRLFIIVAVTSGFFSAVSSAIGFSLITSQETADFFRNDLLPPAFGVFVFFLSVAIWVGGAELVRQRDWFRNAGDNALGDALFFIERALKLFVVIPALAVILFFVSTWTTAVGIGGADAVRHTYQFEIDRLQSECAGISAYRQKDYLFLDDLRLSIAGVTRVVQSERDGGAQSGAAGPGAVTDYYTGIAAWLRDLEASVATIIEAPDPSGLSPYETGLCSTKIDEMKRLLGRNAHENYDQWAREFETVYNNFANVLNRWRHDRRIEQLLELQLASFDRANPRPVGARLSPSQRSAIERYAGEIEKALKSLISKQKRAKPPVPQQSAAQLSPERGLDIMQALINPPPPAPKPEKVSRTAAAVAAEFIPGLSTISPRDAVLKNANIFSDIWALAISWDYAPYLLLFVYLFFPSAERAAGYKDER